MKKVMKKFFGGVVLSLSLAFTVTSCLDSGLGPAVDTEVPQITMDYPSDAAVIRDWFYVSGSCKDDKGVTRVEVQIKKSGTTESPVKYNAEIIGGKRWRVKLNEPVAGGYGTYYREDGKGYTFPDGKYSISAFAYDASGKVSGEFTRSYVIDNSAPFMIIKSPGIDAAQSSKAEEGGKDPTPYGANFKITGTIVEDNEVSEMLLNIYDAETSDVKNGRLDPIALRVPMKYENINIAGGTEEVVATCSGLYEKGGKLRNWYEDVYGADPDLMDEYITKYFYCGITLIDSARLFQDPNGKSVSSVKGNETKEVYINDVINEQIMTTSTGKQYGLSAKQIAQILNDTYKVYDSQLNPSFDYKNNTDDVKVEARKTISTLTAFSLNPDATPKYNVSGFAMPDTDLDTNLTANSEQTLSITAMAGRDNYFVNPKTLVYYIFVYIWSL